VLTDHCQQFRITKNFGEQKETHGIANNCMTVQRAATKSNAGSPSRWASRVVQAQWQRKLEQGKAIDCKAVQRNAGCAFARGRNPGSVGIQKQAIAA